jgi:hypothetical protein
MQWADTLLDFWGIYQFNSLKKQKRTYTFDEKLKDLNTAGILTPNLLKRINKYRNSVEHMYTIPDKKQLLDYYDVASMFIELTDRYLKLEIISEITSDDLISAPPGSKWSHLGAIERMAGEMTLNRNDGTIVIAASDNLENFEINIIVSGDTEKREFLTLLRLWYEQVL